MGEGIGLLSRLVSKPQSTCTGSLNRCVPNKEARVDGVAVAGGEAYEGPPKHPVGRREFAANYRMPRN